MPTAGWMAIGGAAWAVAAFGVAVVAGRLASLERRERCSRCGSGSAGPRGICPACLRATIRVLRPARISTRPAAVR